MDDARSVSQLLTRGFDVNSPSEQGQHALYMAIREGSEKVVGALLNTPGIQVDVANAVGETPLMMAALRGRLDWCEQLIERGAKVNRPGWAPLHYAASGAQPKAVTLLLDHGAATEAPSPNHTTPLMMAAQYGDEGNVHVLLARGASAKVRNERNLNAADFARLGGREKLAKLLEQLAAN